MSRARELEEHEELQSTPVIPLLNAEKGAAAESMLVYQGPYGQLKSASKADDNTPLKAIAMANQQAQIEDI